MLQVLRPLPAHKGKTDEPHLPAFARGSFFFTGGIGARAFAFRCLASPSTKSRPPLPRCLRPGAQKILSGSGRILPSTGSVSGAWTWKGGPGAVRESETSSKMCCSAASACRACQASKSSKAAKAGSQLCVEIRSASCDARCEVRLRLPSRGSWRRGGSPRVGRAASFRAKAREAPPKPSNSQLLRGSRFAAFASRPSPCFWPLEVLHCPKLRLRAEPLRGPSLSALLPTRRLRPSSTSGEAKPKKASGLRTSHDSAFGRRVSRMRRLMQAHPRHISSADLGTERANWKADGRCSFRKDSDEDGKVRLSSLMLWLPRLII